MKSFRVALALSSFALLGQAWADVRTLHPVQHIDPPDGYTALGPDIAIDGRHMIVMAFSINGQAALLFHRETPTSPFTFERALQSITTTSTRAAEVAMKNGIAVLRFANQEWIYEFNGSTYVPATTAQPLNHPGGVAISGNSILIGGNGCDYDAVIYQKGAGGIWGVTGNLNDHAGACLPAGYSVELNYDYAILLPNSSGAQATAWRRNGTALDWVPAGTLTPPSGSQVSPFALQSATAVGGGNYVFRRSGSTWPQVGRALGDNFYNTLGTGGYKVVYRDGVLLLNEAVETADPYAYVETSPGHFEHVAVLDTTDDTQTQDISKNIVVALTRDFEVDRSGVDVFELPTPLPAPAPIVNDFETRDLSGFSFPAVPQSWSLAKRGTNDVLRQQGDNGGAIATLNGSNWSGYRRIEADITPTYNGSITWVGLIVRFVDIDHYYYARIDGANKASIYRHRAGTPDTLIAATTIAAATKLHVSFSDDGIQQVLTVNGSRVSAAASPSADNGPAGLITWQAAADFDNVHVSGTEPFTLLYKDYSRTGPIEGQDFTYKNGNWQELPDYSGAQDYALAQTSPNGTALATIGVPVKNQQVYSIVRLDAFNSATTGGWYGLVARYQDAQNYYSAAVRSNGQVQIRKTVNGVVTILGAGGFTPTPGNYHTMIFRLINDELKLFIDNVEIANAHDSTFATGQYGLATHYAQARWQAIVVSEP